MDNQPYYLRKLISVEGYRRFKLHMIHENLTIFNITEYNII